MANNEPPPEPDLASQARATHRNRLVALAAELEIVADVANGKVVRPDVPVEWLRPLAAPRYGEQAAELLQRWVALFGDDLETVWRARNSVIYGEYISDGNLAAAAQIAERLLAAVRNAPKRG